MTAVGASAFEGRSDVTAVSIPSGITGIGDRAFAGCAALRSVRVPDTVTAIGEDPFAGCAALTVTAYCADGSTPYNSVIGVYCRANGIACDYEVEDDDPFGPWLDNAPAP